jgi:uncharacterized protein YndB with AHSA1/START domain
MRELFDELAAMQRTVRDGTLPAGEARLVALSRTYQAEIDDVWDALTDPARIARWFLPVTGDLRLGGTYQLEGNAGGEIRECEPPHHLRVTWIMGEQPPEDSSFVDVRLEPSDNGTRFVLEHTAVVPPEFWDEYGPGAVGVGWDLALIGLAAHLAGEDLDPSQLESSPEMRRALTASSEAWGNALRDTGADPAVVARMVAGTTAFYVPPQN